MKIISRRTPATPGLFYFFIAGTAVLQLLLAVPAAAAARGAVEVS